MMRVIALTCALLLIADPVAAAEPLGRLFFTPAQRSSLDVARNQKTRTTVDTEGTDEPAAPTPEVLTYEGMVRRSDGKTTVWINNRALHEKEAVGGTSIVNRPRSDGSIRLQIPQSGRAVDLKVGQSVELLSGSIEENYARRAIAPKPEAPKSAAGTPAAGAMPSKPGPQSPMGSPAARQRDEPEERQAAAQEEALPPGAAPSATLPRGK
jgi:hypothetical protein